MTPERIAATAALLVGILVASAGSLWAATLTVEAGAKRALGSAALLARPEVRTIVVPDDASFLRQMTYRAIPLRALLAGPQWARATTIRIIAADGFVTNLPAKLVFDGAPKRATAWLAIEPANRPWPKLSDGKTAGPFYLVWTDPAASGVLREQWPYQVVSIDAVDDPQARWPQLAFPKGAAIDPVVAKGRDLVMVQCMACHRVNGAGDAAVGPDLNRPHNPTDYFQPWALRALIRDPASVRDWPERHMAGFPKAAMSDADVDAIIAYLGFTAKQPR